MIRKLTEPVLEVATVIPPILLLVTLIVAAVPPVPKPIGKKKGEFEVEARVKLIFPVADWEPMVLLSIFTLPFKWEIILWAVETLEVVIEIFAIVLPVILLKAPLAVVIRMNLGVGVPVVPPV
jgi:hypothetical protein